MKQLLLASLMGSAIALATSAMAKGTDLQALEQAARAEGAVNSVCLLYTSPSPRD